MNNFEQAVEELVRVFYEKTIKKNVREAALDAISQLQGIYNELKTENKCLTSLGTSLT